MYVENDELHLRRRSALPSSWRFGNGRKKTEQTNKIPTIDFIYTSTTPISLGVRGFNQKLKHRAA